MQSGPIAAFSAKAEKNACLRQASIRRARRTFREVPYAEQDTPFGGLPYGEQDPLSQQAPYAERNARLRQASICQAGRHRLPERAFDCPNVRFMQDRCHVRIAGYSSFLTFHAGISCWRRRHRPFKSRSLTPSKETSFKKRLVSPFEHGSAAEAEFVPRRRPLFVPRRRLLKRKSRLP